MTQEKRTARPQVRFHVEITETGYGAARWCAHFRARAVVWGQSVIDREWGLFDPDSYELPWEGRPSALKGLVITAQTDRDHIRHAGDEFYGQEFGYDRSPALIRPRDAEDIVKVLRRTDRGMDRLAEKMGRPATLAQYATHVARTLTTAQRPFVRWLRAGEDDPEGTRHRSMDASGLADWIWRECTEIRKKHGIETGE